MYKSKVYKKLFPLNKYFEMTFSFYEVIKPDYLYYQYYMNLFNLENILESLIKFFDVFISIYIAIIVLYKK